MAICASRRLVGAQKGKCCFRMVEVRKIVPRLGGVAPLTSHHGSICSIRSRRSHQCAESPLMRVCVTIRASDSWPVILRRRFRFEIGGCLVTVVAWDRHMASLQIKPSVGVSAQAECGWQKPLQIVAMFTSIEVWCGGKLPGMLVGVAVRAELELHFINGR